MLRDRQCRMTLQPVETEMGEMKNLLITVYGGGDEAVAAVQRMGDDWREQLEQAAAEIERLRGYRDEAESDAAVARLLVDRLRLTDAEREAVETAALEADAHQHTGRAATLRGLLDRVTEPLPKEKLA